MYEMCMMFKLFLPGMYDTDLGVGGDGLGGAFQSLLYINIYIYIFIYLFIKL